MHSILDVLPLQATVISSRSYTRTLADTFVFVNSEHTSTGEGQELMHLFEVCVHTSASCCLAL